MFVQPVLVYAGDRDALRRAYERTMSRGVTPAVYTRDLFETNHDDANRAAVAVVAADDLDLVGIAFRAERKTVDKIVDRLRFHRDDVRAGRECRPGPDHVGLGPAHLDAVMEQPLRETIRLGVAPLSPAMRHET